MQVARHESARVVLQGRAEFEAHDVVITGDQTFVVPDGFRMVVSQVRMSGFGAVGVMKTWGQVPGVGTSWKK